MNNFSADYAPFLRASYVECKNVIDNLEYI